MEKSFKQESISKKLSTFLSERKENVAGYKTKTVNKKKSQWKYGAKLVQKPKINSRAL